MMTSALWLTVACGPSPSSSGAKTVKGPDGKRCILVDDEKEPVLPLPGERPTHESSLWLDVEVPTSALEARIAQEIPKVLAEEKDRDVGAPGRATFKVTRKNPQISETQSQLLVTVPLSLSISVCKPIGSACLKYGSCEPELLTTFAFDKEAAADYELSPPTASVSASRRCVIGMDVTPHILSAAEQELSKVRQEITQKWPKLKPEVKKGYKTFEDPLKITDDTCFYFSPEKVFFAAPHLVEVSGKKKNDQNSEEVLRAGFGLVGEIRSAPDCTATQKLGKLPALTSFKKDVPVSTLWLPETVSRQDLEADLAPRLEALGAGQLLQMRLAQDRIALQLKGVPEFCSAAWVTAQLEAKDGALHLSDLDVVGVEAPEQVAKLKNLLSELTLPLRLSETVLEASRESFSAELKSHIKSQAQFELQPLKSKKLLVHSTADELWVLQKVTTRARVTGLGQP